MMFLTIPEGMAEGRKWSETALMEQLLRQKGELYIVDIDRAHRKHYKEILLPDQGSDS